MKTARHRIAELTSSFGAGVIGVGLGVLLSRFLENAIAPILLLGIIMHVWGMVDMSRLEKLAGDAYLPAWSSALFWVCWIGLGALLLYIVTQ